jgi:hypothetical protein
MRRNWEETRNEAAVVHSEPAQLHGPGFLHHPALPSSALPPGYHGGVPGTLENELFKTDERVHALRTKLSRLEADMVHGTHASVSGFIRIVVTHLVAGGHLGLQMRGCMVSEVVDPQAREFGWFVGDRILKVNGYPVDVEADFGREVTRAMDAYRMTGRPLVFDIVREPSPGMGPFPLCGKGAPPLPGKGGKGTPPLSPRGGKGGYAFKGKGPPYNAPPYGSPPMDMHDPQLQRLAEENRHLRQSLENDMIGQSMIMNGESFKGGKGSFGSMGPFDTRVASPPRSMIMPSSGMIPPPGSGPPSMRSVGVGASLPPGFVPPTSGMMPPASMGAGSFPTMDMRPPGSMGMRSASPNRTKHAIC